MPRNGSGVYSLPPGINPVVTQTLITSNWANTTMTDIANALTASVARDGQSAMTGNLNMAGFQIKNLGAPTDAGSAVSLGFVQSGAQFRLTNISGTANQITANLPGGVAALTLGQLVELIPTANNTGPVQLNVNGIGYSNVLTGIGNQLAANSLLANKLYLLGWDGVEWVILYAPNEMSFAQSAISGWDRPVGGYPPITKVNANTVAIPSGKGRIIAPSTRDVTGVTEVSWNAQQVVLTNIANAWATTLAVDATGAIVQLIGIVQSQWARQYIILGVVGHVDGQIETIVMQPSIYGDMAYEAYDLGTMLHNTITAGGQLSNATAPMSVDVAAGTMWLVGGNPNNANQPNFVNFAQQPTINFWPTTGNNTVGAKTTVVPVAQYDPAGAGVLVNIPAPASQAVIHRLFYMAGQYIFVYGQTLYGSLQNAIQALNTDNTLFKPPGKLQGATLFGYIIAQANCANINDGLTGQILAPNAAQASAGTGSGVGEAPLTGLGYARRNATWIESPYYSATDGTVMVGHNTDAFGQAVHVNAAPGQTKTLDFQSSGLARWAWTSGNGAESGANAGSDFTLNAYADNGGLLNAPLRFTRSTGFAYFDPGAVTIGHENLAGVSRLFVDAAAGQQKKIQFQTAGKARWEIGSNSDVEAGAGVGSSFFIARFDDTGANIDVPFTMDRKTAKITYAPASGVQANFYLSGNNSAPQLALNTVQAGLNRYIAGRTNDLNRWSIQLGDNVAESGGNAGSNFSITRYSDAGAAIDSAMVINRSNGAVTFSQPVTTGAYFVANQNFVSSTNAVSLTTTGAGTIYLRPNGLGSSVGQVTVSSNGALAISTSGITNSLGVTDPSGPHVSWSGGGGSYPSKWIRLNNSTMEWINGQYNAVIMALQDFGSGATALNVGSLYPNADNTSPIGTSAKRFTVVYATTGTINTCDMRTKNTIVDCGLGLDFVNAIPVKTYKLNVGENKVTYPDNPPIGQDEEGNDIYNTELPEPIITPVPGTRTHVGALSQDVVTALTAAGVDPSSMAMWCLADPADPDSLQQLRPDELMWVLWTAVQQLSAQVEALQAKLP